MERESEGEEDLEREDEPETEPEGGERWPRPGFAIVRAQQEIIETLAKP